MKEAPEKYINGHRGSILFRMTKARMKGAFYVAR